MLNSINGIPDRAHQPLLAWFAAMSPENKVNLASQLVQHLDSAPTYLRGPASLAENMLFLHNYKISLKYGGNIASCNGVPNQYIELTGSVIDKVRVIYGPSATLASRDDALLEAVAQVRDQLVKLQILKKA